MKAYFLYNLLLWWGGWFAFVMQGWVSFVATNSSFGVMGLHCLNALPAVFLSMSSMNLGNRYSRKSVIVVTDVIQAIIAFILGAYPLYYGEYSVPLMAGGLFFSGWCKALANPLRNAFLADLGAVEGGRGILQKQLAENLGCAIAVATALVVAWQFGKTELVYAFAYFFRGTLSLLGCAILFRLKVRKTSQPTTGSKRSLKEMLSLSFQESESSRLLQLYAVNVFFGVTYYLLPGFCSELMGETAGRDLNLQMRLIEPIASAVGLALVYVRPFNKPWERLSMQGIRNILVFTGLCSIAFPLMVEPMSVLLLFTISRPLGTAAFAAVMSKLQGAEERRNLRGALFGITSATFALANLNYLMMSTLADFTGETEVLVLNAILYTVLSVWVLR